MIEKRSMGGNNAIQRSNQIRWFATAVLALLLAATTSWTQAQQAGGAPPPPPGAGDAAYGPGPGRGPGAMGRDAGVFFIGFEAGLGGKTVTGAPFSAKFSTQTTQTLSDGNQIQRSTTGTISRDSQGRTRRDMTLPSVGPWAASGKPAPHVVFLNDPVAGVNYVLQPDEKVARKIARPGREGNARRGRRGGKPGPPPGDEGGPDVVATPLGAQVINGVSAEGTRYTRTIPVGAIGNGKPIVITTERWYSNDLQMVVLSKRSDPRTGETISQLTGIQRNEPDAALFQVPGDYTVKQGAPNAAYRRQKLQQ